MRKLTIQEEVLQITMDAAPNSQYTIFSSWNILISARSPDLLLRGGFLGSTAAFAGIKKWGKQKSELMPP